MAEDALSKFKGLFGGVKPAAPASPAPSPSESQTARQAYEAYEAFEAEVRTPYCELRVHSSGLSYFFDYNQIEVPIFNFRTGTEIMFTACGYAVTIQGRNLGAVMRALRLRACGMVQDYSPDFFVLPQPEDPDAPLVGSISVEALSRPPTER